MLGRSHRLAVRHKVWLEASDRFVLGDGGVELLRAVEATGSLRAAAERVGWSYRHVLRYLSHAEVAFGDRLVARVRGGNERGGARLTPCGRDLLRRYTRFRRRLRTAVQGLYGSAFGRGSR